MGGQPTGYKNDIFEHFEQLEEQIEDVIELDGYTMVQKTKSTVYEPTDDEFFALANLGVQK